VVGSEEGAGGSGYILGHSAGERARLDDQGAILRHFTERLLRDAGIGAGMTVLDAGCGTGDVTLLVAGLVGPSGAVMGVDHSGAVLETARPRAAGLPHVRFVEADLAAYVHDRPLDAVVGRCVLTHLRERVATLARLAAQVRAGGVVAFGEPVLASPPWLTRPRPLLSACMAWVVETLQRSGARADTGLALPELFADAGLPGPDFRVDGVPAVGPDRAWLAVLAGFVRSALPAMERYGVATAEQVGLDTLLDRLVDEGRTQGGTVLGICLGGAWARLG
jgi:SAM-dependent methyltransferase